MPDSPNPRFIADSALGYEVWCDGHRAGYCAKSDEGWIARHGDIDLGSFRTRKEAADAICDIDRT